MADPNPPNEPAVNPHTLTPPDFSTAAFSRARQALTQSGLAASDEAAAQLMLEDWTTDVERLRADWDANHQEEEEEQEREAEPPRAIAAPKQANQAKAITFPKVSTTLPAPSRIDPIPQQYAINRLRKFEYVELYPFTPEAVVEGAALSRTADEWDLVGSSQDGAVSLRPPKKTVSDLELTWGQFTAAKTLYLRYLTKTGWPEILVSSLSSFFIRIENHPLVYESTSGKAALLRYQAVTRFDWCEAVKTSMATQEEPEVWDISEIQEHLLSDCMRQTENANAENLRREVCNHALPSY